MNKNASLLSNKILLYVAEKFYNAARWCEGRAITINIGISKKNNVFKTFDNRSTGMAGSFGIMNIDSRDPEVRRGLIRGWKRSPKIVVSNAVWSDGRRVHSDRNPDATVIKLKSVRRKK